MQTLEVVFYVFALIALVCALLLSGHGNASGINPVSGNDIELFKKTKDRGVVKVLQFILFFLVVLLVVLGLIIRFILV